MRCCGGIKRAAAGSRPQGVRILPLGSPTGVPNWSYVHVPSARYTVFVPGTSMSVEQVGTRGGAGRWVPGEG